MNKLSICALWLQHLFGRVAIFITAPLIICAIKLAGYRIRDLRNIRQEIAHTMRQHSGPWLICANHLTMIDSFILAYAMFPAYRYMLQYRLVPWNVPEHKNFNRGILLSVFCYLVKCIPVKRGGNRNSVKRSMDKCAYLLNHGQNLMIFPEGTRSRTGRLSFENCTYHVGRLEYKIPNTCVLCIYLRGDRQKTYSNFPRFGETFTAMACQFRPKTELKGLRAHRDCARQIINHLSKMEAAYFDALGKRRRRPQSAGDKRKKHRHPVYVQSIDPS